LREREAKSEPKKRKSKKKQWTSTTIAP
jgi:hypothetical protein